MIEVWRKNLVQTAIGKGERVFLYDRLEILSVDSSGDAANLKDVDEVSIENQIDRQVDGRHVEVFEAEAIEKNIRAQQLFAANVDRVLRQIEGIAQGDVAGCELDLGGKGLLGAGGKHDRAVAVDAQLELAQEPVSW